MSETKHTPGPWEATRYGNKIEIGAETPAGHLTVAIVHLGDNHTQTEAEEGMRDAVLLAAAPDLLAVAQDLRNIFEADGDDECTCEPNDICPFCRCVNAIKKAKGESV